MNLKCSSKSISVILHLYSCLIKPPFENIEQCLSPYFASEFVKSEAVQHEAAKLISFSPNKCSKEMLAELNLFSLVK